MLRNKLSGWIDEEAEQEQGVILHLQVLQFGAKQWIYYKIQPEASDTKVSMAASVCQIRQQESTLSSFFFSDRIVLFVFWSKW